MNLRTTVGISLVLAAPLSVLADSYSYESNIAYAKSGKFRENSKILRMSFSPTIEQHAQRTATEISWAIAFYLNSKAGKQLECRLRERSIEGCPIVPLGMGGYDLAGTADFLLKSQQDDWYEVYISPISQETAWLNEIPQTISAKILPVEEWIKSQDGLEVVNKKIQIFNEKSLEGQRTTVCGSSGPSNGYSLRSSGLLLTGPLEGDWLAVTCLTPNCYDEADPLLEFAGSTARLEKLKKLPGCKKGWIHWRTEDGTLNVVPKESFPDC